MYHLRLSVCLVLFSVVVSGCDLVSQLPDGNDIFLRTGQQSYEPGGDVELRLVNNSDDTFRVRILCELRLQKQIDGKWKQVWKQRSCYDAVVEVEPDSENEFEVTLPNDLTKGLYRYTLGRATSNDFAVNEEMNYDYAFEGEVVALPDAFTGYVINSDEGQSFEPTELEEQFQKEGIRVRVKATEVQLMSLAQVGPTIRIEEIEEI